MGKGRWQLRWPSSWLQGPEPGPCFRLAGLNKCWDWTADGMGTVLPVPSTNAHVHMPAQPRSQVAASHSRTRDLPRQEGDSWGRVQVVEWLTKRPGLSRMTGTRWHGERENYSWVGHLMGLTLKH